uniref:Glycosyl hydrolase family 109 protein n=1 Tax=uncultured Armatimonadetes bacterium TaxID=157466 RepID=A0A6J4HQI8_9BACT|nr:GH109 [uncultured Armatimonadetes bacterium]
MVDVTRRDFLRATGGAAAAVAAGIGGSTTAARAEEAPQARAASANDKIVLGIIGVGGRGYGTHLDWFGKHPDVAIGAVCDVHQPYVERAVAKLGGAAKGYNDFRKLLEQKDIDAVVVCTPPQWHAIMSVAACEAGKDVYCEKPLSRYPAEIRAMVKAARDNKRVTQDGTQIHATENYARCVDIVRSGALGQVTAVRNFCTMNDDSEGLGTPPDSAPPPGLDWDMWLGPAPKVPFNIGRFRDGMHRYFADYVDSWLHELGPHIVDLPFWALDLGQPVRVSALGGRYATNSIATVPDTMDVVWEFPNKMLMTWTMMQQSAFGFGLGSSGGGRQHGTVFHGKDATALLSNYGTPQVIGKDGKPVEGREYPDVTPPSPGQEREFLDAVKTRKDPSCSFERHLPLHIALNLAHVALRTGRTLHWDAAKFEVTGDKEATRLLNPPYRSPWKLSA